MDVIGKFIATEGIEVAISKYQSLKKSKSEQYNFNKWELNTLGYDLIKLENIAEAIEIFKLNVDSYPEYASAYSGLGEAYRLNENIKLAIENFEKSLELHPDSDFAKRKIKQSQSD